jgi:hypothetical protein
MRQDDESRGNVASLSNFCQPADDFCLDVGVLGISLGHPVLRAFIRKVNRDSVSNPLLIFRRPSPMK